MLKTDLAQNFENSLDIKGEGVNKRRTHDQKSFDFSTGHLKPRPTPY